ncbi:protein export protein prsA [Fictibacillus macauensis ZFHKF-1]|uniref:Foldase protein PrsA n=1 Tax=Fictibacillus macauensis ZFHKF-1 TaxID=1196324 RepID=I8UGA0_9BACL|nr:peptidylprolyl isomerase [Fictibacillus macauensis]EIT85858.1 protein export protein prsA [Fictibacillus macauensis ZFHKF-1]
MKKWLLSIGLAATVASLGACSNSGSDSDKVAESKVGDITKEDFYKEMKKQAGKQIIKQMIDIKLLEDKYKVSDKEIDKRIEELEQKSGGKAQFKEKIKSSGINTEKELKEQIKIGLLQEKATQDGVTVSDADIKKAFDEQYKGKEEVKARHILVKEKKLADEIKAKLDKGADFAELVKKYSTDTGTKNNGGDLGYNPKGKMVPEFDKAQFSLKKNEISKPIKTNYGYHIIQVLDKREPSLEDKKKELTDALKQQKQKPITEILENLEKKANVKFNDKDLKDALKPQPQPAMPGQG